MLWPGLAVGAVAAALILMPHHARIRPSETLNAETLGGLFELEAALAPAEPLLDPENREAVLHLTPTNRSLP